jgi:hypothetical protein
LSDVIEGLNDTGTALEPLLHAGAMQAGESCSSVLTRSLQDTGSTVPWVAAEEPCLEPPAEMPLQLEPILKRQQGVNKANLVPLTAELCVEVIRATGLQVTYNKGQAFKGKRFQTMQLFTLQTRQHFGVYA